MHQQSDSPLGGSITWVMWLKGAEKNVRIDEHL
jgi:hypothetical protein